MLTTPNFLEAVDFSEKMVFQKRQKNGDPCNNIAVLIDFLFTLHYIYRIELSCFSIDVNQNDTDWAVILTTSPKLTEEKILAMGDKLVHVFLGYLDGQIQNSSKIDDIWRKLTL